MIDKKTKEDCCGCMACLQACPQSAIACVEDEKGFIYPAVDASKCNKCGICCKVCGFVDDYENYGSDPVVYAAKHKDLAIRASSTSGGMFAAISDHILDMGGVVYGAGFGDRLVVCHKRATTKSQRDELKGSKYVQSYIGDCFNLVREDLKNGMCVLFTGTPCQVSGLKAFLRVPQDNLYTVDLICHGTPSNKLWQEYLDIIEKRAKSKISKYQFRDFENWQYAFSNIKIEFERGVTKKVIGSGSFLELFLKWCMLRPSCYNCKFTNFGRVGDITIADFWGINKIIPDFDCCKGVSLVLVNSQKGVTLFDNIKNNLEIRRCSKSDCMQEQLTHPAKCHPGTENFWQDYQKRGMQYVMMKYTDYSFSTTLLKKALFKINMLLGRN